MYTAPDNPLHFVSKLPEHFNSLEPTRNRDQTCKQTYVDQGLMDADRVLVRNDEYKPPLAMHCSVQYKIIEKHSLKTFITLVSPFFQRKITEANQKTDLWTVNYCIITAACNIVTYRYRIVVAW